MGTTTGNIAAICFVVAADAVVMFRAGAPQGTQGEQVLRKCASVYEEPARHRDPNQK